MSKFKLDVALVIFLLIVCVSLFSTGIGDALQAHRSKSWPSVEGTVVSSKVTSHSSSIRGSSGTSCKAEVRYQYQIDGASYENDVLRFGQIKTGIRSFPEGDVKRHPLGETVVYYDPEEPENSVLEPGLNLSLTVPLLIKVPFLVFGVVWFRGRMAERSSLSPDP